MRSHIDVEIRNLIVQIDRPIQQLLISVRQEQQSGRTSKRQGVSGNVGGNNGRIFFGQPGRGDMTMQYRHNDDVVRAQIGERDESLDDNISQQVRAMSGKPAYISVGVSRPLLRQQITTSPGGVIRTYSADYDHVASGFYVTPSYPRSSAAILENGFLWEVATRVRAGHLPYGSISATVRKRT